MEKVCFLHLKYFFYNYTNARRIKDQRTLKIKLKQIEKTQTTKHQI